MKSLKLFLILSIALTNMQCKKSVVGCTNSSAINYNPEANEDDGYCIIPGEATFWIDGITGLIDITIDGTTETITKYYPNFSPICSSEGCATFTLLPGTYSYSAIAQGSGAVLNGSVQIQNGSCTLIKLTP